MSDKVVQLSGYRDIKTDLEVLKGGGGDGTFDSMEQRVTRLEVRVDAIDARLERIEKGIERIADKALTKWDVAQVVFFVVGALMAAALYGPRIAAMLTSP